VARTSLMPFDKKCKGTLYKKIAKSELNSIKKAKKNAND
jgi:hypothetical protein